MSPPALARAAARRLPDASPLVSTGASASSSGPVQQVAGQIVEGSILVNIGPQRKVTGEELSCPLRAQKIRPTPREGGVFRNIANRTRHAD
jgi:hypothetical protein